MEKKDYFVAIDLGSNNVIVVVGCKGDEGKVDVVDVAVAPVEGQGVMRGEIKNIEAVAKSIKEAVEQIEERLGIKIIDAYTGISGQHIKCAKHSYFVYVGRDGEIREEDVQKLTDSMRNVQAPEGEKILMILPQNYIVNDEEEVSNPVGMFGKKLEATFNFIIGNNASVSRLEKALMKVDLKQTQMFLNPLVSAEAVVLPDEKEMGVVVLDIGAGTTDMCIYYDKMVRHVAVIPIGSDSINKDIRSYGILERYVEDLKVQYGSALSETASADKLIKVPGRTPREPREISFKNLASIIEARMQDILDYVMAEVKRAGCESKLGAGIVITGGGANLKDLDTLVKNYTGMDVRVASPDVSVGVESIEIAANPALATAIGILKKGIEGGRPNKIETIRRIVPTGSQFGKERQETDTLKNDAEQYGNASARNSEHDDDSFTASKQENPKVKKDKKEWKNPFKKLTDGFTRLFDVIDDNEI